MKLIFSTCIVLISLLSNCGKTYFKLSNASETRWFAGKEDGANGQDISIFLTVKEGVKPVFDSIWMDGRGGKLETKYLNKTLTEVKATFIHKASVSFGISASPQIASPIRYHGRALIRYSVDDKIKYFVVKEFLSTQPIYMP